eukprot:CFRG1717T1
MRIAVLLAVALVGTAQAFYPRHVVEEAAQKAYAELEDRYELGGGLLHRLGDHITPHAWTWGRPNPEEGGGKCMECRHTANRQIMGAVVDHLKRMCAHTQCPVMKKHCAMAKAHPKVAFGYLLVMVRPMRLSAAYCYGKGECPRPVGPHCHCQDNEDSLEHRFTPLNTIDMPVDENGEGFVSVVEKLTNNGASMLAGVETDLSLFTTAADEKCHQCLHSVTGKVFTCAVAKIKEWCAKTTCPCEKKKCQMAKEHPKIAAGVILALLRPEEWACGFCFGDKSCVAEKDVEGNDYLTAVLEQARNMKF